VPVVVDRLAAAAVATFSSLSDTAYGGGMLFIALIESWRSCSAAPTLASLLRLL